MTPSKLPSITVPFSVEQSNAANDAWGFNCGPGAFATMLNIQPSDAKPFFDTVGFPAKKYTNAVMMQKALEFAGVPYLQTTHSAREFAHYGLCRVQWHGPWMKEGVPIRARLRHTHWVGSLLAPGHNICIFDIHAGWQLLGDWNATTVPELAAMDKRRDGQWTITHRIELFTTKAP